MRSLRVLLEPLLLGFLIYFSIENFGRPDGGYNRQVAGYMLVVAAVLLLAGFLSSRRLELDRSTVRIGAALVASMAISTLSAPNMYVSINQLHLYFAAVVLGLGLYISQPPNARRAVGAFFAVVAIAHAYFLVQIFFWLLSVQEETTIPLHRMPHYANIRHFAYHGFIAAASATALFIMARRFEVTSLVLTSAALFGIVLLGARGALIAWLVCVSVLACFHKERARLVIFSLVAAAISVGLAYYLTSFGMVRAPTLLARVGGGTETAFHVADRLAIWADAIRAILDRPWFGYGPEGYIMSRCCNPHVAQPHNFVLQFLLEWGVIGTGLMLLAAWSMIRFFGRGRVIVGALASDTGILGLVAVLLSFLAYATIDGLLYHAIPVVHFAVFVALFFAAVRPSSARPAQFRSEIVPEIEDVSTPAGTSMPHPPPATVR